MPFRHSSSKFRFLEIQGSYDGFAVLLYAAGKNSLAQNMTGAAMYLYELLPMFALLR